MTVFESFIIMLREGIEAALVVGILLVAARSIGRADLERAVLWGLAWAVLASLGAAFALSRFPVGEEVYEGTLYWVSAAFVVSMMVWMHRNARGLKARLEGRVREAGAVSVTGAARERWGLGALAFLMVFREGAETVLFLGAVSLTTDALMSFAGAVGGLALAVAFCVSFVRGSLRIDLARFFRVTEWVLGIFVAQLVVNGYHEFSEVGLLPANRLSMSIVGPIVRNNSLFLLAILAIPFLLLLTRRAPAAAAEDSASLAEKRLALARVRADLFWRRAALATTAVILVSVGVVYAQELNPETLPPPDPAPVIGGEVVVPLASFEDGGLKRMALPAGDVAVRFIAVQASDGKVRAALDACEICGDFGYRQEAGGLVCLNCTAEINAATLHVGGGCNPIPVPHEIREGSLRIRVADLQSFAGRFHAAPAAEASGASPAASAALEGIDPVCGMRIRLEEAAEFLTHEGRTYYFCSSKCRALFEGDPASYAK